MVVVSGPGFAQTCCCWLTALCCQANQLGGKAAACYVDLPVLQTRGNSATSESCMLPL